MSKTNKAQLGAKFGLISRLDYGSEGFRQALIEAGFDILKQEATPFNALVGGLIAQKNVSKKLQSFIKETLYEDKAKKRKFPEFDSLPAHERPSARKKQLENEFLMNIAKDLAKIIPQLTITDPEDAKKEKLVDLFIMTSPAYDGEIGETVAHFLADLRPDIRLWHQGGDRLFVKYVDKIIWALAPEKAVWMRGDYYSTTAERIIKDKIRQTTQSPPDAFVVGCGASSINKPKGELNYRYVTTGALSRLEETRTTENQVTVRVLEYPQDGKNYLVRTYDVKDLVARELSFIAPPENTSPTQKKIIEIMKAQNWVTPGILKNKLELSEEEIMKEMNSLEKKKSVQKKGGSWPGITFVGAGKKYYFNFPWIQRKLRYVVPQGPYNEDSIISFACLHGGSIETDYEFFVNDVPNIILSRNAKTLVGAGDITEGMEHDLDRKGEIIAGMNNNTIQQKFSARLVTTVKLRVFEKNLEKILENTDRNKIDRETVRKIVLEALLYFYYIPGNHDLWITKYGNLPLDTLHSELMHMLAA